jgi:hypothetical protein
MGGIRSLPGMPRRQRSGASSPWGGWSLQHHRHGGRPREALPAVRVGGPARRPRQRGPPLGARRHRALILDALGHVLAEPGIRVLPVDDMFRMQPGSLERIIDEQRAQGNYILACVVAYAGDSRSMSIDKPRLPGHAAGGERDVWFHVDACHGSQLANSPNRTAASCGASRGPTPITIDPLTRSCGSPTPAPSSCSGSPVRWPTSPPTPT